MMKKYLAALLVAAVSISAIGLPSAPAQAGGYYSDDYDGWSGDRSYRDSYYRDRGDDYYRDRDYRSNRSDRHKGRDTAIIAGVAGLALGAVIVGSLAKQNQNRAPVYDRPANHDRLIYDPNY
ncbi:hypothetical protein [Phyllobacterium myrsinacearum]|uniref:Transmembrane protein n=1 Tax=Phyllobacterium myrsinacearum TaxID=28101 RepID=A0A839EIW6_9HYPH|nr:hypothetical protein [Phyllobacterium myrsinacearum]MBA8878195.1 hypothetical protein [Phyllobacterium myrsinacearum]